jgi:hypothetical protein
VSDGPPSATDVGVLRVADGVLVARFVDAALTTAGIVHDGTCTPWPAPPATLCVTGGAASWGARCVTVNVCDPDGTVHDTVVTRWLASHPRTDPALRTDVLDVVFGACAARLGAAPHTASGLDDPDAVARFLGAVAPLLRHEPLDVDALRRACDDLVAGR